MSGLVAFLALMGVVGMSLAASMDLGGQDDDLNGAEDAVALALRAGSIYGIPLPDFITDIPVLGTLIAQFATILPNMTAGVLNPALDVVSALTSGAVSRDSSLFKLIDGLSGGAFSALSGAGGIRPPAFDSANLIQIIAQGVDSASSTSNSVMAPLFQLFNIPGSAIGSLIQQATATLQGIPFFRTISARPLPVVAPTRSA